MIRNLFCVLTAVVWTAAIFPIAVLGFVLTGKQATSLKAVQKLWAPVLVWAGGGKMEILGAENVERDRPYIFVSNHQSTLDIPILFMAIPADASMVAKKQLIYVPFIGWYMWIARFVFVDRGNQRTRFSAGRASSSSPRARARSRSR
jgi:1-acyl-sn-glycerol-3-phosphate acyltransferase